MLDYNLSHYLPISAADNKELEMVLKTNNLPKMNMMMFNIFKILGKREKEEFTPHDLKELVDNIADHEGDDEYRRQIQNIKNYLTHLDTTRIVSPVRKVSEFLEGDMVEPDPHFFGTVVTQVAKVEQEHRKITNVPEKGKRSWLMLGFILAVICLVAFAGWYLWDSGALSNMMPSFGTQPGTTNQLMQQYPTPEAMKAAIDRGELDYNTLPPDMKKMVDAYEPPTVVATP